MSFKSFVQHYTEDMQTRIKENTWATKEHIIQTKLIPYFGKLKMCNITAQQIITWQNELINYKDDNGKSYSPVYLKTIHNQLSAIFNHAVKYYNLKENPCRKAGSMGKKKNREMLFWTKDEYLKFADAMMDMERYGVEWLQLGTKREHLSVLDYKKQEREKEIIALDDKLAEKKDEFRIMAERIENFDNGEKALQNLDESIMNEPEYQLPEPAAMMSARSYKTKFVEPLISRLKSLISTLFARYFKAIDSYNRLNITNGNLYRTNERLIKINEKLKTENETLKSENKDYRLLRKAFGHKQIDELLEKARNIKGQKRDNSRSR